MGHFLSEDSLRFASGKNFYVYVENGPINFTDPSGLCMIQIGHHPVGPAIPCDMPLGMPSGELPPPEHTYIIVGNGKDDHEKYATAFDSAPSEQLYPWNNPELHSVLAWLYPGVDETEHIKNDPLITVVADDGRPCKEDIRILRQFSDALNASHIPYRLLHENSNAAAADGLQALRLNWSPSDFWAPGWGTPLKIRH